MICEGSPIPYAFIAYIQSLCSLLYGIKVKALSTFFFFNMSFRLKRSDAAHTTPHTINIIFVVKFIWRRANARNGRKRLKFRFYHYQLSVEHCIWPTGKIVKREIASINQSGSNGANGKKN